MRREQVLKVCCNHRISPDLTLKPLNTSETSLVWQAMDFTEGEAKLEKFAVKFKVGSHRLVMCYFVENLSKDLFSLC